MTWTVTYWAGGGLTSTLNASGDDWQAMPREGVLWLDVEHRGYRHRLQCRDFYWTSGERFGMFDAGTDGVAYRAGERGFERTGPGVPSGAVVFAGVLIPDDDARRLGLI